MNPEESDMNELNSRWRPHWMCGLAMLAVLCPTGCTEDGTLPDWWPDDQPGDQVDPEPAPSPEPEPQLEPFTCDAERDRSAILEMAGTFDVSFDFREVEAIASGYTLREPYMTSGLEVVIPIADLP
jgi:hypothetical protein